MIISNKDYYIILGSSQSFHCGDLRNHRHPKSSWWKIKQVSKLIHGSSTFSFSFFFLLISFLNHF